MTESTVVSERTHFGLIHANCSGALTAFATSNAFRKSGPLREILHHDRDGGNDTLDRMRTQMGQHSVLCLYRVWGKPIENIETHNDWSNKYTLRTFAERMKGPLAETREFCKFRGRLLHAYCHNPTLYNLYEMRDQCLAHSDAVDVLITWSELEKFIELTCDFVDCLADVARMPEFESGEVRYVRLYPQMSNIIEKAIDDWNSYLVQ